MELSDFNTKDFAARGACYRSEAKYIAQLTGNEVPPQHRDFFKALRYTNRASGLGLNELEVETLGRMLTMLGEGTRFAGDPVMHPEHGENSSSHSLQCVNVMERVFHQAWKALNSADKERTAHSAAPLKQLTAITLILHDMGEILGETGFATRDGASFEEGFSKTELERLIMQRTLPLAIGCETREAFFDIIRDMRDRLNLAAITRDKGTLTRAMVEEVLNDPKYLHPELNSEQHRAYRQFMALWEMAEEPHRFDKTNYPDVILPDSPAFTGQLVKSIEHVQGQRHFNRFARRRGGEEHFFQRVQSSVMDLVSKTSENGLKKTLQDLFNQTHETLFTSSDPAIQTLDAIEQFKPERMVRGLKYSEGELGSLFDLVKKNDDPFIQRLVRVQRDTVYATSMDLLDTMLSAYKYTDVARMQGDTQKQSELANDYLEALETLHTAYERAIAEDRMPPADEISLGAQYVNLKQPPPHDSPRGVISASDTSVAPYLEKRRELAA